VAFGHISRRAIARRIDRAINAALTERCPLCKRNVAPESIAFDNDVIRTSHQCGCWYDFQRTRPYTSLPTRIDRVR
jgi:hypothetical protein